MSTTTKARALGKDFDVSVVVPIADLDGSGQTGNRINLANYSGVTFVVVTGAGTTDDVTVVLQEANAATGGTIQDLAIITDFYVKEEATLDGDEAWTKVTQSASATIAPRADSAEKQTLWAIEVRADQLSDGFNHVSLNVPDLGSGGAQYGCVLAMLWGLKVQRAPENMPVQLY